MRYEITIAGKTNPVDLTRAEVASQDTPFLESYNAMVQGKDLTISVLKRERGHLVLSIGDRIISVKQFKRSNFSVSFLANNALVLAEIKGSNSSFVHGSSSSEVASVKENVTSNFPAKVVKVRVKRGDHLNENDTLIVLEAMKMEAQIKTPKPCVVSEILVREGDMIERGELLARLVFD